MNKSLTLPRKALQQTVFYTVLFSLLAHGYRFLNMSFSGDASLISQAEEVAYQISLGRFLQPILWQIRGTITAPLTIGLFATAALTGSAILVISLLGFKTRLPILLTCGILATNETLGVSYATYLPWMDVYMFAFLFAMIGVYVGVRFRLGRLLSPVFYCISLGLYQSYIQTAVAMVILLLILRLLDGERPASIWAEGVKSCAAILAGLILYAGVLSVVLSVMGIEASGDYNGVRYVFTLNPEDIGDLLVSTYLYPFGFFSRAADSAFVPPLLTGLLLVLGAAALLVSARTLRPFALLTLVFLLAIAPLGVNFVSFISKGITHPLMVYALFFLYIFFIALWQRLPRSRECAPQAALFARAGRRATALLSTIMLVLNILTANQLYFRRDLEFYSTTSAATRILKHADSIEGYVPGETPVCVLGYLPSSMISLVRPGFEALSNLQGMRYTYAASYETSTSWYFQMILGYPVNFVSEDEREAYEESGIASSLPVFPSENCYQLIDGVLFIRLS